MHALLWLLLFAAPAADAADRPNVVIIFADDLGYGDLGCYGHDRFQTPHLDRLAAEGVRLTQFYVPTPYCAPSRGTLLTGRYPWRHGVVRNPAPDGGVNDVGLPSSEVTLAEVLKDAGYATACIGKWHLGHRPEYYPTRHGFDEYLGILYSNDMRPVELVEGRSSRGRAPSVEPDTASDSPRKPRSQAPPGNALHEAPPREPADATRSVANVRSQAEPGNEDAPGNEHARAPAGLGEHAELQVIEYPVVQATLTKRYTARALRFIEQNRDRPFFLYLPHAMPHKPLACSEEFYGKSGDGLYADVLAELDWSIGQVLAALKRHGLDEKTLVIFTSDNGPWFGGSTGGLRGMKGNTWEGGIRVPMIARWPGRLPAGRTVADPCGSIDVFPSVLAACGLDAAESNPPLDGRNILPVLRGESQTPHAALFAMQGGRLRTIRSGRWKLHVALPGPSRYQADASRWVDPRAPDGVTILAPHEQYRPDTYPGVLTGDPEQRMMLFDLDEDPGEQRNVASRHADVVERLKARFDEMEASVRATGRRQPPSNPPSTTRSPGRRAPR